MKKLNVVLRTCDSHSVSSTRIVDKQQCVLRCFHSLVTSLEHSTLKYKLHVIDDNSSDQTVSFLKKIAPQANFQLVKKTLDSNLNPKQRSRFTLKLAYDVVDQLPDDELVYIVEDDYLHYKNTINILIEAQNYFQNFIPNKSIGIFPQDFTELYPHPQNRFNDVYVKPCIVIPGPDRYYRSTWFTHESFVIPVSVIKKYRQYFEQLMQIGTYDGLWEGNTISNVWESSDVIMLMPMPTLVYHLGKNSDISFFTGDTWKTLWEENNVF